MTWRRVGEPRTPGPAPKAALRFELLRIARSSHRHGPDQAASERCAGRAKEEKASATNRSDRLHGRRREKGTRATKINFSRRWRVWAGFYVARCAVATLQRSARLSNSGIQLYVERVISQGLAA